jgi:ABC-type oligopeptide transport system substrate-binding subunit/DNA-binding SARP family transcriptional activator
MDGRGVVVSRLRISLLGAPLLESEGEPLKLDTRKNLALVAYLAVTGEAHTREALVTLLWPEMDPTRARAGLRRNLSVLRKALRGHWLVVDGESVGTDPRAHVWLDVAQFRELLGAWQGHGHTESELCAECFVALGQAVELYRGDFLTGFGLRDSRGFDEWQFFQTESLRQELASALERLARGHSARREHEIAIDYARRWLALDPLRETVHRCLMRNYAWSGQHSAALRQYGECERILEEELGVSPEEETTRLYEAIKARRDPPPPERSGVKPAEPTVLNDRYCLDEELGRGSVGVVYRAHDLVLDRDVAVKVYSAVRMGDEGRARLLDEAQAAAKLNHPSIVTLHDAGDAQGTPFVVAELVEGTSLAAHRPARLEDVLAIVRQVCAALEHAHGQGIVHRDLKPENILITPTGQAKLTDFGLARPIASRVTSEGVISGTVFYLAPELALRQRIDGRADLYALGVVLYELTAGRLPFEADDPLAVISQHLHAPVVPPRAWNPEIPPGLDTLIVELLSKEPQDRPATATAVLQTLDSPGILDRKAAPGEELSLLKRIERGRLVGREREMAEARALWSRVLASEGQVLLVSGEAGVGKTRLVRELVTHVRVLGGRACLGACYAEGGAPYAPFAHIVAQTLAAGADDALEVPGFVLAGLLGLAPALRLDYPHVEPEPKLDDPQAEQQRLFENLTMCVAALSSGAPLLMVLEDVHWADSGTLLLLRHLARHTRHRRVMIVATHRDLGPEQAPALHEMLLDLHRERLGTRQWLPRLDREGTEQLLGILFAEEITPEFLDGIYHETEGNPFFIEEVCKALVDSGKLSYGDGRWHRPPSMEELGIPPSVRVAIESRVDVLPTQAQETLRLAAVLGREFNLATLAMASDQEEEALLDGLERAERAQLIDRLTQEEGGTFGFLHILIPTTLVESIPTLQRRRLHHRAAAALSAQCPDDYETLARHYQQAGEAKKATYFRLQAADRARELYAHQEAIGHYRQALEFLRRAGDPEPVARTLMKLGLTYHSAFDFKAARQAYQEGFVFWQRMADEQRSASDLPPAAPHALRVTAFEPRTLGLGLSMDVISRVVLDQLFGGLVEVSPEMGLVPDMAESWEVSEGGRKYLFRLRKDVRWSDGVPVTARDYEYTWKRLLDPTGGGRWALYLLDIKGAVAYNQGEPGSADLVAVRALDEFTLTVELEEPTSYFPYLLAFIAGYPVPQHVVEAHGDAWVDLDNIVTNGPFCLVSWERGESLVLERNPTYHGRFTGNLQRVECMFHSGQPAKSLHKYEENEVDICGDLPLVELARARQQFAGEYVSGPWLSTDFLGFDQRRPPFDDRRVRRALALATDRETLADVILKGYAFPATGGFVPPGMPGHLPEIGLPYDPESARSLLATAGYADGSGFPAIDCLARDDPGHNLACEYLQAQWLENLGIQIHWKLVRWGSFYDLFSAGAPHLWMVGWHVDYPDPDDFLRVPWWLWFGGWQNRAYDDLVEGARRVRDQAKRMRMYQQADRILVEDVPVAPLWYGRFHMLVKPWVKNFRTSPLKWWSWKDVILEPH